jgi:hypothetical protein
MPGGWDGLRRRFGNSDDFHGCFESDLLNFYEGLLKSLETQEKVRLITRIPTGDNDSPKPAQYLLKKRRYVPGVIGREADMAS